MKNSFPEELFVTGFAKAGTAPVISIVAFRADVRSDARYVASFAPSITQGTGFVTSLALTAKFQTGTLKYLQFYNLTCNDCGGRDTPNCLNATSCALPVSNCTCPAAVQAAADNTTTNNTDGASVCNYGNFTYCATGINLAFEGTDRVSSAFVSASQVTKLNSYSLVELFNRGKSMFFDVQSKYTNNYDAVWGKFSTTQQDIVDAYSGNAQAGRVTGTAG
eukprot:jgi/Chrzof1/2621/Cz11g22220.t1